MKIQVASDLHLELLEKRFPDYRGIDTTDADVLVLAGDISSGTRVFDLFSEWPCPVIFVPGNHEFYHGKLDEVASQFRLLKQQFPNVNVLAPGTVQIAGTRFIGCTLWTDFDVFGAGKRLEAAAECAEKLIDYKLISAEDGSLFSPLIARQIHLAEKKWLKAALSKPFAGKTVVVTHHGPHRKSMDARFADSLTSAAFVSTLTEELDEADLFIHGHVHSASDYSIGTTRILANPLGYCRGIKTASKPSELVPENSAFNPKLVVEV